MRRIIKIWADYLREGEGSGFGAPRKLFFLKRKALCVMGRGVGIDFILSITILLISIT